MVLPIGALGHNTDFQLLLLVLHLLLSLQNDLGEQGQGLLHSQVLKVRLLNLVSADLLSSSTGATVVLVNSARGLNHIELVFALAIIAHCVVACKDKASSLGPGVAVDRGHLELHRDSFADCANGHLDHVHFLVLVDFIAGLLD